MPTFHTSNFFPGIQQHLDKQDEDRATVLDIPCQICRNSKLDISLVARPLTLIETPFTHWTDRINHAAELYAHGFERTVILPCGHIFGERCMSKLVLSETNPRCPSCSYQMIYTGCGHSIPPYPIVVNGTDAIRNTIPLTIPEGATLRNCKECWWRAIKAKMRYALGTECIICTQKAAAGVPTDATEGNPNTEHNAHQSRHFSVGVREALAEIVDLAQPAAVGMRTDKIDSDATSGLDRRKKAEQDEADRRAVNLSLLNAIVLTEMEDTVWSRTPVAALSRDAIRRHGRGLASIEDCVLGWLMDRESRRRIW
ncbi:hypothetical protein F5Y16DRAFT_395544 [Xylariaceae sp. FL0255]|nr:hypothetical protein F5Y16DRAFT_395544 [Xylariaceae sp. FL0255]